MDKPAQNIQDSFLNNARKEKTPVTIYLMSGVKLAGRIRNFDKYSVILETNNQEQLIFKHAISTVTMAKASISAPTHASAPHASAATHATQPQIATQAAPARAPQSHAETPTDAAPGAPVAAPTRVEGGED